MNWEAVGAVGEVGGFVAVLITLLFLYAQVRQIVAQNKAVAMDTATRSGQLMQLQIATNPEFAALLIESRTDPQNLAPEKRLQLRSYITYITLNWQMMFLQFELGSLPLADWEATKPMIRRAGGDKFIREQMLEVSAFMNPRFHAVLREILDEAD